MMRPRMTGIWGGVVVLAICARTTPAAKLSPVELTTDSVLLIEWVTSDTLVVVLENAPVEDVFKALMAKTGIQVKLPENIHGRVTWRKKSVPLKWSFEALAALSGLRPERAPDGSPKELVPQFPEVYNLSDEELLAANAVQVNPTQPTTGVATGYFLYRGCYVPPPYQVAKKKLDPFRWEISINGIAIEGVIGHPPRTWVPPFPDDGQFDYATGIDRYCKLLWRQGKAAGKSMETLHGEISDFLRVQAFVKSFRINGYTIEISTNDGKSADCVLPLSYPPEGPMGSEPALELCFRHFVRAIALEGKLKSPSEAEPLAIQLLLDQEFVAGPKDLDSALRMEKARKKYHESWPKELVEENWGSTEIDYGGESSDTPAKTEVRAEERRQYIESCFVQRGNYYALGGSLACGMANGESRATLQALVAIAESDLPLDAKLCAAQTATTFSRDAVLRIVANFKPTVEFKERLAADIARAKAEQELRIDLWKERRRNARW